VSNGLKIGYFIFVILSFLGCSETTIHPDERSFLPLNADLPAECKWKTETLQIFEKEDHFVSFRRPQCPQEAGINFFVTENGTQINYAVFDVILGGFAIFEKTEQPIDEFIMNLPQRIFEVGPECMPRKLSEKYWMIDDGREPDAKINAMPCGIYGRNFSGQTVFEIRDEIILNYGTYKIFGGIDKTSIKYIKPSP